MPKFKILAEWIDNERDLVVVKRACEDHFPAGVSALEVDRSVQGEEQHFKAQCVYDPVDSALDEGSHVQAFHNALHRAFAPHHRKLTVTIAPIAAPAPPPPPDPPIS